MNATLTRTRQWPAVIAALVLMAAVTGCGSKSSSAASSGSSGANSGAASSSTSPVGTISHPKVKFVLHAGLAFGAFHHFILPPIQAGDLKHPFSHKLTLLKAAAAAVFVYHELALALQDAKADPLLSKLIAPLSALHDKLTSLASGIRGGNVDPAAITADAGQVTQLESQAGGLGVPIREAIPSVP